jgi:hypothetical protein
MYRCPKRQPQQRASPSAQLLVAGRRIRYQKTTSIQAARHSSPGKLDKPPGYMVRAIIRMVNANASRHVHRSAARKKKGLSD